MRFCSQFCSYKKASGGKQRALDREGLTREFSIKSAVPQDNLSPEQGRVTRQVGGPQRYERQGIVACGRVGRGPSRGREGSFMRMYFGEGQGQSLTIIGRQWGGRRSIGMGIDGPLPRQGPWSASRSGSKAFLGKSILETHVSYGLKALGHRVLNVYDGLSFRDDFSVEEIEAYVSETATCLVRGKMAKAGASPNLYGRRSRYDYRPMPSQFPDLGLSLRMRLITCCQ
jgi:hypothetical protein